MRHRILLGVVLIVLVTPLFATAGVAQSTNTTNAPAGSSGEYSLEELRRGGTTTADAPDSMRFLGQYGSATLRYDPVGFGSEEWEYVAPGTRVNLNHVTLRTIRLGDPSEDLTVHVVSWQQGTRTVKTEEGTTSTPVARNVSESVVEVSLGRGYDEADVPLPASYGETQRITMWVEEYPDARWTFKHRSIATARPISISSWGGFLSTIFWEIGIFAFPAMLVGGGLAKRHHEKAIVGPQWGMTKWLLALAIPIAVMASFFAFQGAVVATRIPAAIGLLFGPITYALVLEGSDVGLDKFLFRRQDLEHATSPRGEETHDSRFVDHVVKTGVRREADQELVLIRPGLKAYLARLRGSLATLDVSEIETHKKGKESPYELEIELDPEWRLEDALVHEPPRLTRLPLTETFDLPGIGPTELPNPGFVLPIGGGAAAGWFIADYALGIPGVGAAAGVLVGLPFIHRVENGGAESEPAPYHFTQAEASLAAEGEEYADSKLIDEYREIAWRERLKTPLDARDTVQKFDAAVSRELSDAELGVSEGLEMDPDATEPTEVDADDD
jgi:hypothetical protein